MSGYEAHLATFTVHPKMGHSAPCLTVIALGQAIMHRIIGPDTVGGVAPGMRMSVATAALPRPAFG